MFFFKVDSAVFFTEIKLDEFFYKFGSREINDFENEIKGIFINFNFSFNFNFKLERFNDYNYSFE